MQNGTTGEWQITLTKVNAAVPSTVTILATSSQAIEYVIVDNTVANSVLLNIRGTPMADDLPSIGLIDFIDDEGGGVRLDDLRCSGDVGDVRVSAIATPGIETDGDIVGDITVIEAGFSPDVGGAIKCGMDLIGNIYVEGNLGSLDVGGDAGTSGNPITIEVGGNLQEFKALGTGAGNVFADLDVAGDIWDFAIEGDFTGSISADRLRDGTSAPPGLMIDGECDADVTFERAILGPLVVGAVASGRTIQANGNLDEPTGVDRDGTITVEGNMAGTLRLGRVYGDITIEGNMTGAIDVDETLPMAARRTRAPCATPSRSKAICLA